VRRATQAARVSVSNDGDYVDVVGGTFRPRYADEGLVTAGRQCPRCKGSMLPEDDRQHGGTDWTCASCGHIEYGIRQGDAQLVDDATEGQYAKGLRKRDPMHGKIRL